MARFVIIFVAFALARLASAKKDSFVLRSTANSALSVRGGDHLDPADTAKVGILLAGTNAALTLMSPSRTLEVYGAKDSSPLLSELLAQKQGIYVLGFCLAAWQLIVKKSDLNTATASLVLPWTIMNCKALWNEDHKKIGYPLGRQIISYILAPLTLYACKTDASYAGTLIKACAVWSVANGIIMTLLPDKACEAYGVEASDENKASIKTLGYLCGGSGVFQALNSFTDMDPLQAFGYAWVPALIMQIETFITQSDICYLSYAWAILDLIIVTVCGLQIG